MSSRDSDSDSADDLSSEDEGVKIRNPNTKAAPANAKKGSDDDDDIDTVATPTSGSEPKVKADAKPKSDVKAEPKPEPVKPPQQPIAPAPVVPVTPVAPVAPAAKPAPAVVTAVAPTPPPAARASPVQTVPAKPPQTPPKPAVPTRKAASPSPPKPKPKPPAKPKPAEKPKQALQKSSSTNQPQVGRYASSTESVKARVQATQKEKKDHPSPEKRKVKGKPKTDAKFVLGKRVDEICQHPSAAFASATPRDIFYEVIHPDVPAPGNYAKDRPAPVIPAFPSCKEKSRDHPAGFGSSCPRDSIYTLTNGSTTYRKYEKEFFAVAEPKPGTGKTVRRQSAPPIQTSVCGTPLVRAAPKEKPPLDKQKTYERIALYSSFDVGASAQAAAWAKSKTPRLAIDIALALEQKATPKDKQKPPNSPKDSQPKLADVLEKARKEVEKRAAKRDPAGPAFGTKCPRECLTILSTCTPPPGQYEIP